jgi:protein arginine N-methyltransferase 2
MDLTNFTYENSNLYNSRGHAVMMEWEREWMKKSAEIVCKNGGDILNIGHGLGLVDSYIQEHKPKSHTIIEIHPQVHKYMKENGWYDRAKVIESDWRKVIDTLPTFDGIYFDTWNGLSGDLEYGIIEKLDCLLNKGGIFSFWHNTDKELERLNKICDKKQFDLFYQKMYLNIPKEQHKNGKTYIDPDLEYVLLPIIVNTNEPKTFKKSVI